MDAIILLTYLRPILTVTWIWNIWETGDIYEWSVTCSIVDVNNCRRSRRWGAFSCLTFSRLADTLSHPVLTNYCSWNNLCNVTWKFAEICFFYHAMCFHQTIRVRGMLNEQMSKRPSLTFFFFFLMMNLFDLLIFDLLIYFSSQIVSFAFKKNY